MHYVFIYVLMHYYWDLLPASEAVMQRHNTHAQCDFNKVN